LPDGSPEPADRARARRFFPGAAPDAATAGRGGAAAAGAMTGGRGTAGATGAPGGLAAGPPGSAWPLAEACPATVGALRAEPGDNGFSPPVLPLFENPSFVLTDSPMWPARQQV
jgi:hypothetical protein